MSIDNLMAYFLIYSFLGWAIESLYKTVLEKKLVNSGFLYGPVCPIYGFGALIMLIFLKNYSSNIVLLFGIGFIILSIWEYIVGVLLEKLFKTKYWDYSSRKFNINGRVCLRNSCFWGILCVIFIKLVHPPIENIVMQVQRELLIYNNILLCSIFIIDLIFSVIKTYNINISIGLLNDISNKIKQELDKVKEYAGNKAKESEKLQTIIEELKEKQESLKGKLEKQTARLRKAFPTMKHMKLPDFINQRIESIRKNK